MTVSATTTWLVTVKPSVEPKISTVTSTNTSIFICCSVWLMPAWEKLLEKDANYLDRMQVQMATAREFLLIIRLREKKENEIFSYLNRIEKMLAEQGFTSKRAEEEDIKRILAVYFEQNVTTEKFEEFDGERWIILNE